MVLMPRYSRPSYSPPPDDLGVAFEALDTTFTRSVVNFFALNPGARVPDAAKTFGKSRAEVFRQINALEAAGVLTKNPGSGRSAGPNISYSYSVNSERVGEVLNALHDYLIARGVGETSDPPLTAPTTESGT